MSRQRAEAGTVTAEAAVVLPVVAAFVLALVWMVSVGFAQVQVIDAARDAAQAAARGESDEQAVAFARQTAPTGSDVSMTREGGQVHVVVRATAQPPGWLLVPLPSVVVHAEATVEDDRGDG